MSETEPVPDQGGCICRGDFTPGGELIVTVACPVHHLMPDGCRAGEHEVLCACSNFACDHDCTRMERDDEDGHDEAMVCAQCVSAHAEWGWSESPAASDEEGQSHG